MWHVYNIFDFILDLLSLFYYHDKFLERREARRNSETGKHKLKVKNQRERISHEYRRNM